MQLLAKALKTTASLLLVGLVRQPLKLRYVSVDAGHFGTEFLNGDVDLVRSLLDERSQRNRSKSLVFSHMAEYCLLQFSREVLTALVTQLINEMLG